MQCLPPPRRRWQQPPAKARVIRGAIPGSGPAASRPGPGRVPAPWSRAVRSFGQSGRIRRLVDDLLWLARVEDYVAGSDQLTPTDLNNRKTDEAHHNAHHRQKILADFRAARALLLERVDQLDVTLFARAIPHPRLKTPMRLVDHLYFVAEHDDHHLARIWELLHASP